MADAACLQSVGRGEGRGSLRSLQPAPGPSLPRGHFWRGQRAGDPTSSVWAALYLC